MDPNLQLATARLTLPFTWNCDAQSFVDYFARNQEHLSASNPPLAPDFYTLPFWQKRLTQARAEFEAGTGIHLALTLTGQKAVIGTVSFTQIFRGPFQACYLGFGIDEREEGRGLMTEALTQAIRYVFMDWNLHRVMANHLPENQRSGRLLSRLGFLVEGTARDYLLVGDRWRDFVLTSLTNSRWMAGRENS